MMNYNFGYLFEVGLGNFFEVFNCYQFSVEIFNDVRDCFGDKDGWKISFCYMF